MSSGNVWDVRRYYWDWKRNKKDFVFFQLKLVWPNDKDASCVYQLLSFFFQNMNLWHDFLHFIFVSLKSTSLLQILKLVIHSKHSQWLHLFPLICIHTLLFLYVTIFACRSNRLQMFFKLGALKISAHFTKTPVLKTFFHKVAGLNVF